jgi:pyroglutamyl-peptidase
MILITGFEPFNNRESNSSQLLIELLSTEEGVDILTLPVVHNDCFSILKEHLSDKEYSHIIMLGEGKPNSKILLERVALNLLDFNIKDNRGNLFEDVPIVTNGENSLYSTLPIKALANLDKANVEISNSAGTFICNELFYRVQDLFKSTQIKSGFIHVPSELEKNSERLIEVKKTIKSLIHFLEGAND